MADNLTITVASGTAVASTEEVTNLNGGTATPQHVQRILLAFRTGDGTAVDIPGDAANGVDVDVTRSALPTGASTSTKQDTMIGHLDGVEGLLSAISGATDGVEGLLTTIDADTGALGATGDSAATAGGTGTLSAKLRLATAQLEAIKTAVEASWSVSRLLSAATTNATSVKRTAGRVGGWHLYNTNSAERFLKLYDKASAPTVGADAPVMTVPIPPRSGANVEFTRGIAFATGIAFAVTASPADNDTTAVAANEVFVNLLYL